MAQTAVTVHRPAAPTIRTARARKYARASKSDRTLELYAAAWNEFEHYAARHGETALPVEPGLVIDYLTHLAERGQKVSTIELKRAAIAWRHRVAAVPDPTVYEDVKAVMSGIRRELGVAPQKKAPATLAEVRAMVAVLPDTLAGQRDKALLLVGFAGSIAGASHRRVSRLRAWRWW